MPETGSKPHIVLLMADHLRWDVLSCYSDMNVQTPNLDALAAESIVFDGAYCAAPLCMPTRTSMYTGKWPHTHGSLTNGDEAGNVGPERAYSLTGPQHRTYYEVLDEVGYDITHVGVEHYHLDPPIEERVPRAYFGGSKEWREYRRNRSLSKNAQIVANRMPNVIWSDYRPVVSLYREQSRRMLYPHRVEDFMDVFWSRLAADKIAELDTSRPQYIEALFWAPHPPLELPEPYYSMYPPETIELPETVGRWYDGQPASLLIQVCGQMGAGRTREEYREGWSAYLGLVTLVDDCMGRVIKALKDKGIWDDALVIFTQDHGDLMGCHWLTQKHCCYEEAAHLPLLIKLPGGAAGRRGQLTNAIDYCPTVCDYAGADAPDGVQGSSWRPIIENASAPWRDATFVEYSGDRGRNHWPMRAIVADIDGRRWKYIYTQGDVDELYDLEADPLEKESLVNSSDHQALRQQLRERLAQWMRDTGDFVTMASTIGSTNRRTT